MSDTPLPRLIDATPPDLQPRGNRKAFLVVAGCVALVLFGGLLWKTSGRKAVVRKELVDRPVAERDVLSRQSTPRADLAYPSTYSRIPLVQGAPTPSVPLPIQPAVEPVAVPSEPRLPRELPPPPMGLLPPQPPPQEPSGGARELGPSPSRQGRTAGRSPEKPQVKTWLFAKVEQGGMQTSPFGEEEDPEDKAKKEAGTLIPPANWEEPVNPDLVLYPSQIIQAQLLHDVNSDIPGEVRVLIVQDVQSKFGHGPILIPQYSEAIAHTEGTPKFGQKRLDVKIRAIETRDGKLIGIDGASLGDARGAAGVPGKVDNHYPELAIGAILTVGLSAGSRLAVGNQGTYRPSVEEEMIEDVSREINRTGNRLIEQRFNRPPTIYAEKDTPLTIQLKKPLSFQTKPRKVYK